MSKKIPQIVKHIRNNPPIPVNWAYQKNISHSQISIYKSCPYRWKLQYKDKIKSFTSNIHTVFGSAIHEVLQKYLDLMYNDSVKNANNLNLEEEFQNKFIEEYNKEYKANSSTHFSSANEMREFFEDGVAILEFFKKKKGKFFSKRGWYLVGCEIPIINTPIKTYSNVLYMGYLDVVLYHEPTNRFHIIDLKTSTRGWNEKNKKDEGKISQIVLYKKYFSEQFEIPIEDITVEFLILKRKIWEESEYPQSRIQSFLPPAGKIKLNKFSNDVETFIKEVFDKENNIKDINYPKTPSKWNCSFCPFAEDKKNCGEGIKFLK